ncbi:MAG TPA: hypothetical protein VEI02_13905, partial [Planctomycetota bacterium]|nr:hypothetical protein [Planctomycetota bacterium]
GGASPAFALGTDFTPNDGGIGGQCFGAFDVELSRGNVQGGIANPAAVLIPGPPGAAVTGPVTFVLAVNGPGAANLTTSAFAHSLSRGNTLTNVACKFQGGGFGAEESGTIGNTPDCSAGGWVVGTPSLGSTLTFVETGGVGCCGCLVVSLDPTPTVWEGISLPVGLPFFAVISTCFTQSYRIETFDLQIPAMPELVGVTFYGAVLLVDASLTQFSWSDQFPLTITL